MTREEFQKFFEEWVLAAEGGYVNDKYDAGGETKYGVSKAQYPHLDIPNLTRQQAADIYWGDYYLARKCDEYPEPLSQVLCDMYINTSPRRVNRYLQQALNTFVKYGKSGSITHYLAVDGILGGQTRLAIQMIIETVSAEALARELLFQRVDLYTDLGQFRRYGKGWIDHRVLGLKDYLRL